MKNQKVVSGEGPVVMRPVAASQDLKTVVGDSSSIILLYKAGLVHVFLARYDLVVAASVYSELVRKGKDGADELGGIFADRVVGAAVKNSVPGMGGGESDTVSLFREGVGDFVLLDDRKAAHFCQKEHIPFISSILFPRILFLTGHIAERACVEQMRILFELGYYSEKIKSRAENMTAGQLVKFFPDRQPADELKL